MRASHIFNNQLSVADMSFLNETNFQDAISYVIKKIIYFSEVAGNCA